MQKKLSLIFIVFLILGPISIGINCKAIKNIFSPEDKEWNKWAKNVECVYERTLPYESTEDYDAMVQLEITQVGDTIEGWGCVSGATMQKENERRFKLIIDKIPAEKTLYAWVFDPGKDMPWPNNQFVGRKIIINGTEVTDIRKDLANNEWDAAYFKLKEDGTVMPGYLK